MFALFKLHQRPCSLLPLKGGIENEVAPMKNVKKSFSPFQEMYWLRSVGPWVNQFSRSDDVQTDKPKPRNLQGLLVNNYKKRHAKKKKKKTKLIQFDAQRKKPNTWKKTLFICRLNGGANEIILQEFFQQYGKLSKLKLIRNSKTGKSRCYAFIEYEDGVSCDKAYSDSRETDFIINSGKVLVDYARCSAEVPQTTPQLCTSTCTSTLLAPQ